jgi:hypothetical protein
MEVSLIPALIKNSDKAGFIFVFPDLSISSDKRVMLFSQIIVPGTKAFCDDP